MQFQDYFHLKEVVTRELFEIYFLLGFKKLATSMIGIFLPLYLFVELGYSLQTVILFFIVWIISFALMLYPATKCVSRYGAKHCMIFSAPILIIALLLIMFLQKYSFLFYPAAIFTGAELAFFWIGFHIDAALQGKKKSIGRESALISVIGILPTIFGPFIGGLILIYFNFTVLFVLSLALAIISFVPLIFSKEIYAKTDFDWKYLMKKTHIKYFFAFFAQGVRGTTRLVFWPLFIFAILGGYLSMGVYGTVATLVTSIMGLFIGGWADKGRKSFIIRVSGFFETIFWFLRAFVSTVAQVFGIGILGGFSYLGVSIPLLAKSYYRAKKEKVAGFIFFREMCVRLGGLTVLLIILYIGDVKVAFYVTAVTSLFFIFF
tara:strand:- start:93 stop:1220 length:1128 start_codon:yes stop_codon:yes gene_type:complete